MPVSSFTFLGFKLKPCHEITSPNKGTLVHLYIWSTFSNVLSWFIPYFSEPPNKMSSAIPNKFDMPLNNSFIFFWNVSPAESAPNGRCMDLYLSNGQENVVK